jgi:HK97 gp10 family phage protein
LTDFIFMSADGVTITVRRKDALLKKLGNLAPAVFQAVADANHQTADEMVDLARGFAPVKTGRLRDSIVATGPGETTPAYSQGGGSGAVPEGSYAVSAGNTKVRYAHLVEFGTAPHINAGKFKGSHNPGTRPRPFFWPAYRLVRKKMRSRAVRSINKSVKAVAGSGGGGT